MLKLALGLIHCYSSMFPRVALGMAIFAVKIIDVNDYRIA